MPVYFAGKKENSFRCNHVYIDAAEIQLFNNGQVNNGTIPTLEEEVHRQSTCEGKRDGNKELDAELDLKHINKNLNTQLPQLDTSTTTNADNAEKNCECDFPKILCKILIIVSLSLLFISPFLTVYLGFISRFCDDTISTYFIVGGVICSVDCLVALCIFAEILGKIKVVKKCWLLILIPSLTIIIWLAVGFFIIFRGYILYEEGKIAMDDPGCKSYLHIIPFWFTLSPCIIIIHVMYLIHLFHAMHVV